MKLLFKLIFLVLWLNVHSQETNIVVLNQNEVQNFRETMQFKTEIKSMYDSILNEACKILNHVPRPLEIIYYEAENGASIKKSVEYVIPYATGEKQRKEWINTKVELDKKRAAAGIKKYQPGKLFDPKQAWEMFQWACYYNPDWYTIFNNEETEKYSSFWVGLLNSPLVRTN